MIPLVILIIFLCVSGFLGIFFGLRNYNRNQTIPQPQQYKKYRCDVNNGCVEDANGPLTKEECELNCNWYGFSSERACKASITSVGNKIPSYSKSDCLQQYILYSCSDNTKTCTVDSACVSDDGEKCFSDINECINRTQCKPAATQYYKCNDANQCELNAGCSPNPKDCFLAEDCSKCSKPTPVLYSCDSEKGTCSKNDACKAIGPNCMEKCPDKCPTYECKTDTGGSNTCQPSNCTPSSDVTNCYYSSTCNGSCSSIVDDKWEGWATTTFFGEEQKYPELSNRKSINNVNSKLYKLKKGTVLYKNKLRNVEIYGAAIPWGIYAKLGYKSIQESADDSIWSSRGIPDRWLEKPPCFLIQQINKFPDELKNTTSEIPSSQIPCSNTSECYDINDDEIAKDSNGKETDMMLIIPYEGCGGDCNKDCHDCVNNMGDIIYKFMDDFSVSLDSANKACSGIKAQKDTNWEWTEDTEQKYLGISKEELSNPDPNKFQNDDIGISKRTGYGRNRNQWARQQPWMGHVNHCTSHNMHFDIAVPGGELDNVPFLRDLPNSEFAQGGNVLVRWKRVQCNLIGDLVGDFDICTNFSLNPPCTVEKICNARKSDGKVPCGSSGGGGSNLDDGAACSDASQCKSGSCSIKMCQVKGRDPQSSLQGDRCYAANWTRVCRNGDKCNNLPDGTECVAYP